MIKRNWKSLVNLNANLSQAYRTHAAEAFQFRKAVNAKTNSLDAVSALSSPAETAPSESHFDRFSNTLSAEAAD